MRTARRATLTGMLVALSAACGATTHHAALSSTPVLHSSPSPAPSPSARPIAPRYHWPLTGLPAASPVRLPALSIKIDNVPQARPQAGLDLTDLVVENPVEGGLSRLFAVFHTHPADLVGPIRSARPVDGALLRALHGGIFAYSGAAPGEIAPAKAYSTALLLSNDADPRPFERLRSRRAPQNVFASTDALRAEAARLGGAQLPPPQLFRYGPPPAGSTPASSVSVVLGSDASARWVRTGATYARWENGTPHLLADGAQVTAVNVVVLRVRVVGSGIYDAAHNEDPFVLAYGSGTAQVLRDGVVETGTWSRPRVEDPFRFVSTAGTPLTLRPGNTWIELVPTTGSVTLG